MSCPEHIIDNVERARNNITIVFKLAHDVYGTITNNDNNPADMRNDVASSQSACDALLASFKSTLLEGSF
ncbi:hypothetical protein QCA50_004666 [Cerrena zonata]|uniref:Uncharacterized protein n=1 Tax=Cerrena zonata TaxID=2478898 RepID=A0AAW0GCV2_9APHY